MEVSALPRTGSGGLIAAVMAFAMIVGAAGVGATGDHTFFAGSGVAFTTGAVVAVMAWFAVSGSGRSAIIRDSVVGSITSESRRNSSS